MPHFVHVIEEVGLLVGGIRVCPASRSMLQDSGTQYGVIGCGGGMLYGFAAIESDLN